MRLPFLFVALKGRIARLLRLLFARAIFVLETFAYCLDVVIRCFKFFRSTVSLLAELSTVVAAIFAGYTVLNPDPLARYLQKILDSSNLAASILDRIATNTGTTAGVLTGGLFGAVSINLMKLGESFGGFEYIGEISNNSGTNLRDVEILVFIVDRTNEIHSPKINKIGLIPSGGHGGIKIGVGNSLGAALSRASHVCLSFRASESANRSTVLFNFAVPPSPQSDSRGNFSEFTDYTLIDSKIALDGPIEVCE